MKKGILLLNLLFWTTMAIGQQSGYLADFTKKWENATAYTLEIAELMPEEHYTFQPTEDTRSFQEQLLHMVGNMTWLSTSYLGGAGLEHDLKKESYTKEEVLTILKDATAYTKEVISKVEVVQLEEMVEFFAGPMNKRQILTLMNDHLTHHRGQTIVYLRLKDLKPPR